jgi:mono/diheme cytochrome c family protein
MRQINNSLLLALALGFLVSCGGNESQSSGGNDEASPGQESTSETLGAPSYDPKRGEGKFTAENTSLGASLDGAMATSGEKVKDVKCASCHKLTEEKLVGPGWQGVTARRKPEWILNFISNPDPMIEKDPAVQAQLELCLVRMPNQGLNDQEAREILEFMRKNDGVK